MTPFLMTHLFQVDETTPFKEHVSLILLCKCGVCVVSGTPTI